MRSPSPYPISSSHHHHTPFTPTPPPSFPLSLSEVSGDSGPCYLAPPFVVEERKREGERERLQPTTTMSPEAPCLLAPPAAQYSCGSVPDPDQLGSQPCQRATRRATVCESSSPLSLTLHQVNHTDTHSKYSCQTSPRSAEKILFFGAWLWHPVPWHFPCPWCSPCSAWHQRPSWEAARRLAGALSPCCSAWSPMVSPGSRHWHRKRART